MCVSEGKNCLFFGDVGVLRFLETPVLRFALYVYYRRVDVKAFPLARTSSESENDLEEEFLFTICGHATLFNAERIFLANKVASLSIKCKPS